MAHERTGWRYERDESISADLEKPIADTVDRVARASRRTSAARFLASRRARRRRRCRGTAATNEPERSLPWSRRRTVR